MAFPPSQGDEILPPHVRASAAALPTSRLKKAPDAPRRFKSAYIFFSTEKHKETKERLGDNIKTTEVARELAEEWKKLSPKDREKWEEMSRRDKLRYEMERDSYVGPWKVQAPKRSRKDPTAPKRPPSAFFDFSNSKRAGIKRENPDADNGTISRILAQMWRDAPEEVRMQHISKEKKLREVYKVAIAEWREKDEKKKEDIRHQREERALKNVERAKSLTIQEAYNAGASEYASLPRADYASLSRQSQGHAGGYPGTYMGQGQGMSAASLAGSYPGHFGGGYLRQNDYNPGDAIGTQARSLEQLILARQLEEHNAEQQLQNTILLHQQMLAQHRHQEAEQVRNIQLAATQQLPQHPYFQGSGLARQEGGRLGYTGGRGPVYGDPALLRQYGGALFGMQQQMYLDPSGVGHAPDYAFPAQDIDTAQRLVDQGQSMEGRGTQRAGEAAVGPVDTEGPRDESPPSASEND